MPRLLPAVLLVFGLLAVSSSRADVVTYKYDDAGRLTRVDYANGTSISYSYDAAGNLLSRTVSAPPSQSPKTAKTKAETKQGAKKQPPPEK